MKATLYTTKATLYDVQQLEEYRKEYEQKFTVGSEVKPTITGFIDWLWAKEGLEDGIAVLKAYIGKQGNGRICKVTFEQWFLLRYPSSSFDRRYWQDKREDCEEAWKAGYEQGFVDGNVVCQVNHSQSVLNS